MNQISKEDQLRLAALFQMATDGIITMDERGYIENVNRAACELFGYGPDELRGQKVNMLMGSHDRQHHDGYLARYQQTRIPHIIGIGREVTGRHKSGREFPLRLAVSEVKLTDGILYTGILHDLREFKEAQLRVEDLNRELEQKVAARTAALEERERQLEVSLSKERELSELKSRFLSLASHEFKTPLSTVLSSAELIELYEHQDQQAKRLRHTGKIKEAVQQLTEVLNDFLSLSQLEQGEVTAQFQTVELRALVSTSIEMSEGQLRPGQEVYFPNDPPSISVETDPKLLRHVLMNLISNAAKYSGEGQLIDVDFGAEKDGIFVSIHDRGIGIPAEDQPYLFDRFFRARNVENVAGTGLGLNIVRHYVTLLGGTIDFTSQPGAGSTFTLHLPRRYATQPA